MSSLSRCIKSNIPTADQPDVIKSLIEKGQEYTNGKLSDKETKIRAVEDTIAELREERDKIVKKILKKDPSLDQVDTIRRQRQAAPIEPDTTPIASKDPEKAMIAALNRVDWNTEEARRILSAIGDETVRDRAMELLEKQAAPTARNILFRFTHDIKASEDAKTLARLLNRLLSETKKDVKIEFNYETDPEKQKQSYNRGTHTVTILPINVRDESPLHEIGHALTAREMIVNPKLRQEVLNLMKVVEKKALEDGKISQANLDIVKGLQYRTSDAFKEAFKDIELLPSERVTLYALLNEFEFMAQMLNQPHYRRYLSTIALPENFTKTPSTLKEKFKSVYDQLLGLFAQIFGKPGQAVNNSVMKRIFDLYTELAHVDVANFEVGDRSYGQDVVPEDALEMQADTPQILKRSMDDRLKIMKEKEVSLVDTPKKWVVEQVDKVKDGIKNYAQSTYERLRKIAPPLANALRKMEFKINEYNQEYHNRIKPFLDEYQKLNQDDKLLLDLALMNASEGNDYAQTRDEILRRNRMMDSYEEVKKVLAEIYQRKDAQGLNKHGELPDYFPRRVKEIDKLRQAMKDDGSYGVIEAKIDGLVSDADKELAITSLINTGRMPPLAFKDPTSSKMRKIHTVSSEWKHHYMDTMGALINHIYETNEAIEARSLFGGAKRKQQVEERENLYNKLTNKKPESESFKKIVDQIRVVEAWLDRHPEVEFGDGIADYLAENAIKLDPKEQTDTIKLLRGRLTQAGMTGPLAAIRNLSLMSVLANPMSAITQIADSMFSVNDAGFDAIRRTLGGDKLISADDLDLVHSMREFQNGATARWLDKALNNFNVPGLKNISMSAIDKFGKELYMNSMINQAKKMSIDEFRNKWGQYLEGDTEQTYKDLQAGIKNERTKFFAFNALSEVQPISLSEMPLKYLTAKNGRILYALKSYNIKFLNSLYKRVVINVREATTPQAKRAALRDAGKFVVLMTLAGATLDELKDFLMGREGATYSDRLTDNLLKMVLVNRYSLSKTERDGFFRSVVSGILLPPFQLADDPITDMRNLLNPDKDSTFYSVRNLPVVGKMYYEWFTATSEKSSYSKLKARIFEDYKDGSPFGSMRGKINKYNAWARKNKETLITFRSLNRNKNRQD